MSYILVIWTVVAASGNLSTYKQYDWRPIGDFQHKASCERAAADLGIINPKMFRCLNKNGA